MEQYQVSGMSCAACSARVERAVRGVSGVTACSVSLLTNSMAVEGTADADAILSAVRHAGYDARRMNGETKAAPNAPLDSASPRLLRRLLASLALLLPLMYLSMGYAMWNLPLPPHLTDHPLAIGILQMLLSAAVMGINHVFFVSGIKGLLHRAPNMDTLVSLGSLASFGYSIYVLFSMNASAHPHEQLHSLYFESAAMILTLITLGKLLEARAKGKTTDALRALMRLSPQTATVLRDGKEVTLPIEEVLVGDCFIVRTGDRIPVDGVIVEGQGAIDESALTGESIPIDKSLGDAVSCATVNTSGYLQCRATRVGEDTTLAQIIQMVSDATATKAPIAKIADTVSGIFVPIVMTISAIVLAIWLMLGAGLEFSITRAVSVLVISCPCALGLATPVAIMVGNGKSAKCGILFKTATALELTGRVQIVALDKTGTVTKGEPEVTDLLGDASLLQIAYSLEIKSEHPIARAIVREAERQGIAALPTEQLEILPGGGLLANAQAGRLAGGNAAFLSSLVPIPQDAQKIAAQLAQAGKTPTFFASGDRFLGIIAVADAIKPDSASAIAELERLGIRTVMLTGDNRTTAEAIAREVGIREVWAEVKPDGKEAVIRDLKQTGKVAMVGDGINDAPSLTRADIGIAIGAGSDVAIDAADVVLVNSRLSDVPAAIRLSRATLKIIHQNLFWAFFYNAICIPVAAGALAFTGLTLSPMLGAAAMSLSSVCVVSNALRLNLVDAHNARRDQAIKQQPIRKEVKMKKIMKIEGMMCPHCEARVKQVLEGCAGVAEATVSHTDGTAIVTLASPVSSETLAGVVTTAGYTVTDVTEA